MRGSGSSLRRAVAASVGVHVLLAAGLVVVVRWAGNRPEPAALPALDTRAAPDLQLEVAPEEVSVPVAAPAEPVKADTPVAKPDSGDSHPPIVKKQDSADAEPETGGSRPPLARIPQTLPPELTALLKRPGPRPDEVVEVPVTPTAMNPRPPAAPSPPGPVRPAGGTAPSESAAPVHGALRPGQTIVYVLDASGSMGEWGKFDSARRALIATLKRQPETVRFQVVVYASSAAAPLPAPVGGCVPATADNVDRMERALRTYEPAGRSNHVEGLKVAVRMQPDMVLILTDADDLSAARFRGVLAQAPKPVTVWVAKVTAVGVEAPVELK
jgi:hypothetical protein